MQIYVAHRGRYYFDISTIGRSAHTCHKYLAVNAIEKMLPVAEELSKLKYFPKITDEMKDLVGAELYTAVGRIFGGLFPGGPSMIPDRCTIRVDTRPQPGVPLEEVKKLIEDAIDKVKARDPALNIEIKVADVKSSFMVPTDSKVVVCLKDAWEKVMSRPAKFLGGSWLADTASVGHCCETVIFGPGGEPVYQPNESLAIGDIEAATRINTLTVLNLMGR
jgi:acetylornithine deacetylase/succinyl-diaminopimelate desuccinylase-like protein